MIDAAGALAPRSVPRHVAIVMDGNRRWATQRGMPAVEGHRRGLDALRRTVSAAVHRGVDVLTVYAFSEENWNRPAVEVEALFALAARFARREGESLAREGVRVRFIGRRERLPRALAEAFDAMEAQTADGRALLLNVAVDYGSRGELAGAVRAIAREVRDGRIDPEHVDDATISSHLFTAGLPDPDLLIRTGGELRLSNFLLYQCAYTELWATPLPWPAFDGAELERAFDAYDARERRFGR